MVNFGLLMAEICWRVLGTPANFNRFSVWAALLQSTLVARQPNFAALNRRCHLGGLYSTGRPSRWALAHILVSSWHICAAAISRHDVGASFQKCLQLLWHRCLTVIIRAFSYNNWFIFIQITRQISTS